jgi:hypothetical protein
MTACLTIDRWHLDCTVPHDMPDPERAVTCVREAVIRDAADRLVVTCERAFPADDQALVFVDRLECAADVAAHWDQDRVSQAIAAALTRSLVARLSAPGVAGVRVFANRADLVASYLVDSVDGTASRRWWYGAFAGLTPLPASGTVRTLLASDHDLGVAALLRLTRSARQRVLCAMNSADAARVRAAWSAPTGGRIDSALRAAADAVAQSQVAGPLSATDAIEIYVAAHAADRGAEGSGLFAAIDALAALRAAVALGHMSAGQLADAVRTDGARALPDALPGTAFKLLAVLADKSREALADAITAASATVRLGDTRARARHSAFGGAFLLLDGIDPLPFAGALERLPPLCDTPAAQLVRFALLAHGAGGPRSAEAFDDPLLRDLLAIDPQITLGVFAKWLTGLSRRSVAALRRAIDIPARLTADDRAWLGATAPWPAGTAATALARGTARVLRGFARRLPGFARSGLAYLHANFLTSTASAECSDTQISVRLGRPPLDLILSIAGLNRRELELAWIEPRRLLLYSAE